MRRLTLLSNNNKNHNNNVELLSQNKERTEIKLKLSNNLIYFDMYFIQIPVRRRFQPKYKMYTFLSMISEKLFLVFAVNTLPVEHI